MIPVFKPILKKDINAAYETIKRRDFWDIFKKY